MIRKSHRVLLIDDGRDIHLLIAQLLSTLDIELLSAYGGEEGLRMAADRAPSLILLDYMMPAYDGLKVLDALKQSTDLNDIPVIMITADNDYDLISKAFEKGVCDYVNKPLHPEEFRARVNAVLKNRALLADLTQKSQFDALTGLPNKAILLDRLQLAMTRAQHSNSTFAVMFIDLDRFKLINDSLGHTFGDLMLQQTSKRLRNNLRRTDTVARCDSHSLVARLGGDEFVILLDTIAAPRDAEIVAQRMLSHLLNPYQVNGRTLYLGASVGIVTATQQYETPGDVLRDADIAMYEAKGNGRGCYKVFNLEMRDRAQRRWKLDLDLRRAVELNQFSLVYQPIIDLNTGDVEGVEALIRWNHPERGLIPPIDFIPMAEETGMIVEIGDWVTRTACQQFAEWSRIDRMAVPRSISINVSRQQLIHRNFVESFQSILRETGVEPSSVHLEVTESEMMKHLDSTIHVMQVLQNLGVKFDLDDFGTGYSSLACLHQIPIDVIKLDRSLISTIDKDDYFMKLTSLVLKLMSETKIKVIAEGIETLSQLKILQDLECTLGQGYYFAKPMPASKIQEFIRKQRDSSQKPVNGGSPVAIPIVQFKQAPPMISNNATG